MSEILTDKYQRTHDYLRISLTDRCNMRCLYCMPENEYDFAPGSRLMQPDEILTLAKIFVAEGVRKIRITGGEPMVRKDFSQIISSLAQLPVELALTTNGTRIHKTIDSLTHAGIQTVNISLDTLQPEKFLLMTKRNLFRQVRDNIDLLLRHQIHVKINVVVLKGINDNEILDFITWTADQPVQVRFIEFMPFDSNQWAPDKVVSMEEILTCVGERYLVLPAQGKAHDTAKHFNIPGHAGGFSVISTMTAPFCSTCNRIRLTADGKFKNCLFSGMETDLLTPLRNNEPLLPLIQQAIQQKARALGGQFGHAMELIDPSAIHNRSMITIGG